jgi:dihydroorotase
MDLLIKGGHVLDPGQGIDAALDIGISGGKISRVAENIPAEEAAKAIEVRGAGRHVVPGLIDLHAHVGPGAITEGVGMDSRGLDDTSVRARVTTVADGGTVGVANLGVFQAHILPRACTQVITFVNVGSHAHTMPGRPDVNWLEDINRGALATAREHNPD